MSFAPWLLAVSACLEPGGGAKDTDGTGDTGPTPPGGTGTTETTATGGPLDALDCDATYDTPAPGGAFATCLTEELSCGDVVFGTLEGGSTVYDYDFWLLVQELDALFGEYDALDGAERVYGFRDPDVTSAIRVTVRSCFEHWPSWILRGDFCDPESSATAGVFESGDGRQWYTERVDPDGIYAFEFVVEGLYGATGNYALMVECF